MNKLKHYQFPTACFLDRDGVVTPNDQSDEDGAFYITCADHLCYRDGALEAISTLSKIMPVFLVTSQKWATLGLPQAAKESAARKITEIHNQFLEDVIAADGYIIATRYLTKEDENKTDAIAEFAEIYEVDLSRSWMIGDSAGDIKAGQANGCKTIYIQNEFAQSPDPGADFVCISLAEAVEVIIGQNS